ncbi:MAG: hypothetical protein GF408_03025 [Candidatus Omnitrophica bacterium]|nr:hypothetical protein [Candidatus Omnitrophota bacterium]
MDEKGSRQNIEKEIEKDVEKKVASCCENLSKECTGGGMAYLLGFVGAAVYYIQEAAGFWPGVVGFLKSLVWPAFLVYEALRFFGA